MTEAPSVNPGNSAEATQSSHTPELEQVSRSVFDDRNQRTTEAGRFNATGTSVFQRNNDSPAV